MKHRTAILLSVALLFSCKSKPPEVGSVKGNVFWKYNNYVGNKPDAGSSVYLYRLGESDRKFSATADVRGDYSIDSIPTGPYLVIVRSKNTTASSHDQYLEVYSNVVMIDTTFNVNTKEIVEKYNPIISEFVEKAREGLFDDNNSKAANKYDQYMDSVAFYSEKAINELPVKLKTELLVFGSATSSVDIKGVYVKKGKVETVVTDFGISYL